MPVQGSREAPKELRGKRLRGLVGAQERVKAQPGSDDIQVIGTPVLQEDRWGRDRAEDGARPKGCFRD